MNMESIAVVNGVICPKVGKFIEMYGRKKQMFLKSGKIVENHILTGKWKSVKISK